jgi:plasmid stabilization system protein ParE
MAGTDLEFHPDAVLEAKSAHEWYAGRSPNAAEAFVAELDHAVELIREAPDRWPGHLNKTRRYVLRRFPFLVIYRKSGSVIQVIAVAHAKRRPGYWRPR